MWLDFALLVVGLGLILFGSDWLVDGASGLARRLGLSEFVIGMTVVAIGTSMPELVSSSFSALQGYGDMAVGNITGSNICNVLLILGITALISPIGYTRSNVRVDIPINIVASLLLILMIYSFRLDSAPHTISRLDGVVLLILFVLFMIYTIRSSKPDKEETSSTAVPMPLWKAIAVSLAGFAALIYGGNLFVEHTVNIAHAFHVSEAFISITLMAVGTSLPELATCIMAAVKHKNQMALGNIIGSNISNILLIIGFSSVLSPLSVQGISMVDLAVFFLSSVVLLTATFLFKRYKIDRMDAVLYLLIYIGYMVWLGMHL